MSTALYRRYRPDSFEDVIGQEHVTRALETALSTSRVAHAYLFSGPRGCGKTTSARILARSLNCVEGPTPTPCGSCPSCLELASGGPGTLDVVEIDAASHGGVDDARELRERLTFAPTRDRYRIFILDEAHMVTPQGFNALLKAVEEPPPHVKFIFATTEPEKVLPTIRSRTHHYPFRLVPPNVLVPYLKTITEREGAELDDSVLSLVVRAGGGSVRDSLSVLDQLIAGSEGKVTHEHAVRLLGYTDEALLDRVIDALGANDGAAVFDQVGELIEAGVDPRQFVSDLLQRLRDLMVCAIAGDRAEDILAGVPADQYATMMRQAAEWGSPLLSRRADIVDEGARDMASAGATAPRLQLELLLARLLVDEPAAGGATGPRAGAVPAESVRPSESVPRTAPKPPPPAPTQAPTPVAAPAPTPEPTASEPAEVADAVDAPVERVPEQAPSHPAPPDLAEPSAPSKDQVRQQWAPILNFLGQRSAMLPSLMQAVRDVSSEGQTVIFSMREQMDVDRFKRAGGEEQLGEALSTIFGRPLRGAVRPVGGEAVAPSRGAAAGETRVTLPQQQPPRAPAPEPAPAPMREPVPAPEPEPAAVVPEPDLVPDLVPEPEPEPFMAEPVRVPEPVRVTEPVPEPEPEFHQPAPAQPAVVPAPPRTGTAPPYFQQRAPQADGSGEEDLDAKYRGRQPVELVTDILGGDVVEEVIEEAPAEVTEKAAEEATAEVTAEAATGVIEEEEGE